MLSTTRRVLAFALVMSMVVPAGPVHADDDAGEKTFFLQDFGAQRAGTAAMQRGPVEAARPLTVRPRRHHEAREHQPRLLADHRRDRAPETVVASLPSVPMPVAKPETLGGAPLPPLPSPTERVLNDPTLQRGDVVMLAQGLRVFNGGSQLPHNDAEFSAIDRAAALDRRYRDDLIAIVRTYDAGAIAPRAAHSGPSKP